MRHPKVLYRSMFSTKGSSSYGKGIASNLVTEEERQKYNSGGRVGYQSRGYVDVGYPWQYPVFPTRFSSKRKIPTLPGGITPILSPGKRGDPYTLIQDYGFTDEEDPLREKRDYISVRGDDERIRTLKNAPKYQESDFAAELEAERAQDLELAEAGANEDFPYKTPNDRFENTVGDWRKDLAIPGTVRDTESLEEETYDPGALMPQLSPYLKAKKEVEGAAEIPPPAKEESIWDYLDKREAAAKKRGLGTALMGSAGDVLVASQLPKKEAIQKLGEGLKAFPLAATKGLEKVEGLKDIAKIQEHIEGAKTEGKIGVEAKKHEGRMDELAEAYKLSNVSKVKLATLKNKFDKDMKEYDIDSMTPELIYKSFMLKNNYNPKGDEKAFALTMITGEHVLPPPKDDKTRNNYLATPGVIFVDEDRIIYKVSKDGIADPVTEAMLGLELQKKEQE